MASYPSTPLTKKLGIKAEYRVLTAGAPKTFQLAELPAGVSVANRGTRADVVIEFAMTKTQLTKRFISIMDKIPADGAVWLACPKKSSEVLTTLTFDVVQAFGLSQGLVDNKVCAIDAT